jgi:hypothetical protein
MGDLELMRVIIGRSLVDGWPIENGLVCEITKNTLEGYSSDSNLAQSLERLSRFSLVWSEGRSWMGFCPLFNYHVVTGEASFMVGLSSCVLKVCNNHGLEVFCAFVRDQVEQCVALKQKDAAA